MNHVRVAESPDGTFAVVTTRTGFVVGARLWKGSLLPPPDCRVQKLPRPEADAAAAQWEKWLAKQARETNCKK